MADDDVLDNGVRYQATNRDVRPDITRDDTNLKRNKTSEKLNKMGDGSGNKQNENNPDD